MSQDSSTPSNPPVAPPAPRRWRSLPGGLRRYFWPILSLFQLGLLLGVLLVYLLGGPRGKDQGQVEPDHPAPQTTLDRGPLDEQRADNLFYAGQYADALGIYQKLVAEVRPDAADNLAYRIALTHEALKDDEKALAAYRDLTGKSDNRQLAAASQLGLARVYLALNQSAKAKEVLYSLILQSADPELRVRPYEGEAHYWLALIMIRDALPAFPPDPIREYVITHPVVDWPIGRVLTWSEPFVGPRIEGDLPAEGTVTVESLDQAVEDSPVTALAEVEVTGLIELLAKSVKLTVRWAPEAHKRLLDRKVKLALANEPLADVLRALVAEPGLAWKIDKSELHILTEKDVPAEWFAGYQRSMARRALRAAILGYPQNPLTPVAALELGNLDLAEEKPTEAILWYSRVIRESPRAGAVQEASYNLGMMLQSVGKITAAREAFLRVIDQSPTGELAGLAYLRLGVMYLKEGDPGQAIPYLRRALSGSAEAMARPAAALALAAGFLLTDNPRAANGVLFQNRQVIDKEPYKLTAIFLDELARFRLDPAPPQARRGAGDLLTAILALTEDPLLGSVTYLLVAQAYGELGFKDKMADVYERTLPLVSGPVADEITYRLGEYALSTGNRELARKRLAPLAAREKSPRAAPAELLLARIALQEQKPKEALATARKLYDERKPVDRAALLKVMGEAFHQLGDYKQAARCFAGEGPL